MVRSGGRTSRKWRTAGSRSRRAGDCDQSIRRGHCGDLRCGIDHEARCRGSIESDRGSSSKSEARDDDHRADRSTRWRKSRDFGRQRDRDRIRRTRGQIILSGPDPIEISPTRRSRAVKFRQNKNSRQIKGHEHRRSCRICAFKNVTPSICRTGPRKLIIRTPKGRGHQPTRRSRRRTNENITEACPCPYPVVMRRHRHADLDRRGHDDGIGADRGPRRAINRD